MPSLNILLRVLQDDLYKVAEGDIEDVGLDGDGFGGGRDISNYIILKDLIGDPKVFSELGWGCRVLVGDSIDGIAELSFDMSHGTSKPDCACDVDVAIVI